jgi:hypothetical protein|tara:strand:+ start:87 stop:287 length:201 start_codon:yes stop_codon:yes gene_type:complete
MEELLLEIIESAKVEALDELERDLEEVDVITDHLPEPKCGMDELVESLSDKEAEYWEMKAEVHFGL